MLVIITVDCTLKHVYEIKIIGLVALDGPELTEPTSTSSTAVQGDDITLMCGTELKGNPVPFVRWISNTGDEIKEIDARFSISNGSEVVSLTILNTTLRDAGIWTCMLHLALPNGTIIQQLQRNLTLTILGECYTRI